MKKLTTVLFLSALILSIPACGGKKDAVATVQKGHFTEAPKITVEEIVKRYNFIKPDTITWKSEKDANNNEYAEISASADASDILFKSLQDYVDSSGYPIAYFQERWHHFFLDAINIPGKFKSENPDLTLSNVWGAGYNYYFSVDRYIPDFFNCDTSTLTIQLTADKDNVAKVLNAFLTFNMVSKINGKEEKYQLVYTIKTDEAENILVNNTDLGYGVDKN